MEYQIPLELAQRLRGLEGSKEWEHLVQYLDHRSRVLSQSLLSKIGEGDPMEVAAKVALVARGGMLEIETLRRLPEICRDIANDNMKRAEARR